jgi:hypothetical protein
MPHRYPGDGDLTFAQGVPPGSESIAIEPPQATWPVKTGFQFFPGKGRERTVSSTDPFVPNQELYVYPSFRLRAAQGFKVHANGKAATIDGGTLSLEPPDPDHDYQRLRVLGRRKLKTQS